MLVYEGEVKPMHGKSYGLCLRTMGFLLPLYYMHHGHFCKRLSWLLLVSDCFTFVVMIFYVWHSKIRLRCQPLMERLLPGVSITIILVGWQNLAKDLRIRSHMMFAAMELIGMLARTI